MKKEVLGLALVAVIAALLTATASAQQCSCEDAPFPELEAECCAFDANLPVKFLCARDRNLRNSGSCPPAGTPCFALCDEAEFNDPNAAILGSSFCRDCDPFAEFSPTVDEYCTFGDKEMECELLYSENYKFYVRPFIGP